MPKWSKVLLSAIAGTILGLLVGAGAACLFIINAPYDNMRGSGDSQVVMQAAIAICLVYVGGFLGSVIGLITALALEARIRTFVFHRTNRSIS